MMMMMMIKLRDDALYRKCWGMEKKLGPLSLQLNKLIF